jgi:hypothetical protein
MRVALLVTLLALSASAAEETLKEITWEKLTSESRPKGSVLENDAELKSNVLRIDVPGPKPESIVLALIDSPGITRNNYAMTGRIRYENVIRRTDEFLAENSGYLMMWSHFPDGGKYFSKTLGDNGPMQAIRGTSGWREFSVPFNAEGAQSRPSKLELILVVPGQCTVWISDLKLTQNSASAEITGAASTKKDMAKLPSISNNFAWWNDQTAGWIGGLTGGVCGCLGALIGILASLGRARHFVLTLMKILAALGVISLFTGIVAVLAGQPYAVYYPLLLVGIIMTAVCGFNIPQVRRRYDEMELRRMRAMDA